MKKLLVVFLVVAFLIFGLAGNPLFGGSHFCFPWAVDNGPGSAWCFYSSSGADPYYTGGVKLEGNW